MDHKWNWEAQNWAHNGDSRSPSHLDATESMFYRITDCHKEKQTAEGLELLAFRDEDKAPAANHKCIRYVNDTSGRAFYQARAAKTLINVIAGITSWKQMTQTFPSQERVESKKEG